MDFTNNSKRDHKNHESINNIDRWYSKSNQYPTSQQRVATHRGWTENGWMTQCFCKDSKLNAVLLSDVQSQKQLEPTDKCASCHKVRNSKTVCGDMMLPTIKRQNRKGNCKMERMQISHEFPRASNHFTYCWADTQHSRRQNSLVDNTANPFTFNLYTGIPSTRHVDKVHVVLKDSRHNQHVKQLEKRVGMNLANSCQQRNRRHESASWIELK